MNFRSILQLTILYLLEQSKLVCARAELIDALVLRRGLNQISERSVDKEDALIVGECDPLGHVLEDTASGAPLTFQITFSCLDFLFNTNTSHSRQDVNIVALQTTRV